MPVRLRLGSVTFQDFEIPESINFGTRQRLKIHPIVGSGRIVDAMGPEPIPIRWKGRFRGINAVSRARSCDSMARAGRRQTLSWGGLSYSVVVESFEATYEKFQEVPYDIECVVIDNAGSGLSSGLVGSLSQVIGADIGALISLGAELG